MAHPNIDISGWVRQLVSPIYDGSSPLELRSNRVLAKMPLVIASPRPDTETSAEYIYRNAYPGMQYEVPVNVQGGEYPFTYALSNAPAGMTIGANYGDADYGIVKWPTPTTGTHASILVTVTDLNGDSISAEYSIICGISKYSFFDASNGDDVTGDGSIGNPYASFRAWDSTDKNTAALAGQIAVHRTGTYATSNLSPVFEDGERYAMGSNKPRVFIGYPGEVAMIDFTDARMSFYVGTTDEVAFHDISFTGFNGTIKRFIEHWANRLTAYRITYDHGASPAGVIGSNAAIFFLGGDPILKMAYSSITHSNFNNLLGLGVTTAYDVQNGVFSDNVINNSNSGIYIKLGANLNITLRNNSGTGNDGVVMRVDNYSDVTNVDLCYNNLEGSAPLVAWGPEATTQVGRWEYRNTLRVTGGSAAIVVENSAATAFLSESSVIEHASAAPNGIDEDFVGNYSGVYSRENLELTDSGVTYTDADGNLIAPYRDAYVGKRGHEVAV